MKKVLFLAVLAIISWNTTIAYAQEKTSVKPQVETALQKKHFTIRINQAIPQSGKSQMLTSEYALTVRNDSLFSYLPYFGVSYNIPYGGGQGLIFNAPLTQYKSQKGKKESTRIEFHTQSEDDRFVYYLTIFPNGKSTLNVQPTNRQGITFYGEMVVEE
ncbi:MAG: DUF4251 domain-containing protein [Phocaeicola sp.]